MEIVIMSMDMVLGATNHSLERTGDDLAFHFVRSYPRQPSSQPLEGRRQRYSARSQG